MNSLKFICPNHGNFINKYQIWNLTKISYGLIKVFSLNRKDVITIVKSSDRKWIWHFFHCISMKKNPNLYIRMKQTQSKIFYVTLTRFFHSSSKLAFLPGSIKSTPNLLGQKVWKAESSFDNVCCWSSNCYSCLFKIISISSQYKFRCFYNHSHQITFTSAYKIIKIENNRKN